MVKTYALLAAVAAAALSTPAMAGFIATTGDPTDLAHPTDTVVNVNNDPAPGAQVGDGFSVAAGRFATYAPTGPNDPQIAGDLDRFGYTIDALVTSVVGNVVSYAGNYRIFYDVNDDSDYDAGTDTSVSFGDIDLTAVFDSLNTAGVTGSLTQTQGPTGPFAGNFADFGARYGNNPATLVGKYVGNPLDGGATGEISGTLTQAAVSTVPTPSAALGGLALVGALSAGKLRRRK